MNQTCFARRPATMRPRDPMLGFSTQQADLSGGASRHVLAKQWQRSGICHILTSSWQPRTKPCSTRREPSSHSEHRKAGVSSLTRSGIYRVCRRETHCGASVQPIRCGSDLQVTNGTSPETPTDHQTAAGPLSKHNTIHHELVSIRLIVRYHLTIVAFA